MEPRNSRTQVTIDASRWPVVVMAAPEGDITDAEWEAFLSEYSQLVESREGNFAAVVDLRRGGALTPKQRQRLTNGEGASRERREQRCVAQALVFSSVMLRNLLTAILWVRKPPFPVKIFGTADEAVAWASGMLAEGGDQSRPRRSLWA